MKREGIRAEITAMVRQQLVPALTEKSTQPKICSTNSRRRREKKHVGATGFLAQPYAGLYLY
jgi:hypothetical protein